MNASSLRTALERAGLTQYEADAYITLVDLGSATAVEIAESSDVPQARIYDVLRELESDGYVELYQEETLRAQAIEPTDIVEEITQQASLMTDAAAELEERWEKPQVEDHTVSVVSRFRTVLEQAATRIDDATYEIEIATTLQRFEQLRDELAAAYDRGVVVKVTITNDPTAPPIDEPEALFDGVATEVRLRQLPTAFLVMVDRTEVCFAPTARLPEGKEYGVIVDDYTLSQIFDWYYQTAVWESWEVVYSARREEWPSTYTDMRNCLLDIAPLVDAGAAIAATVEGRHRQRGDPVSLDGRVTDVTFVDVNGSPSLASFVEEANFVLETDDEQYTVGGWGALLEDVEALRIVIDTVEEP